MSEFSDRPFVAGSLIGLRAFDVDSLGRLKGPAFGGVFTPGENVAQCGGDRRGHSTLAAISRMQSDLARSIAAREESMPESAARERGHVTAGVKCACGYYAYFDGTNTYAQKGRVTAIVEGYGTCTVGSRGFRAEKARLVALVIPDERGARHRHPEWYDRLADFYGRRDLLAPFVGVIAGLCGVAALICGIGLLTEGVLTGAALFPLAALLLLTGATTARASFHGIDRTYPRVSNVSKCYDTPPKRSPFARIRGNYPDVSVFPTMAAAIKAHPLTPPEPVTPETADDFWTRSAS